MADAAGSDVLAPADLPAERGASRWLTWIGSTVDDTVLRAARVAIDSTLMPRADELPRMFEHASVFLAGDLVSDPGRFLAPGTDPIEVTGQRERPSKRLRGGAVVSRRLVVPYRSYQVAAEKPSSDAVRLEHWEHGGEWPRPTILALHGFGMGYPRIDAPALFAHELYRRGFDVALMTLPYHGRRKPPGARFSGQQFTTVDVRTLNDAMRRAVFEVFAVEEWLRQRRGDPVGMMGLSLGGYITSLVAGLLPRLDFAIPIVPPVCIGDLAWRFFRDSRHYAEAEPAALREQLRLAYRVHSPLTYPAAVSRDKLLIVAGRGDRIVPAEHPHALWKHWAEPEIYWFSGSHLAPFRRGALVRRIAAHIDRCCG